MFYGLWSEINVNDDDDDDDDDKPPSDLIKEAHYITLRYITLKVVNSGLLHSVHAGLLDQYTPCWCTAGKRGELVLW